MYCTRTHTHTHTHTLANTFPLCFGMRLKNMFDALRTKWRALLASLPRGRVTDRTTCIAFPLCSGFEHEERKRERGGDFFRRLDTHVSHLHSTPLHFDFFDKIHSRRRRRRRRRRRLPLFCATRVRRRFLTRPVHSRVCRRRLSQCVCVRPSVVRVSYSYK